MICWESNYKTQNMKKIILSLVTVFALGMSAKAQNP